MGVPHKHYGFVQFKHDSAAAASIAKLHQTSIDYRGLLHVSYAMHNEGVEDSPNPRLFIRGLPPYTCREHLEEIAVRFGPVTEILVIINNDTKKCKGSGFLTFERQEDAVRAHNKLNVQRIRFARPEHVLEGKGLE